MARFIFVTGGVVSSLGKGLSSASLAYLLQSRGYKVRLRKLDPYLNVDPGTMSPFEHGEVFVTDDGAETDLDLGHYERFTGVAAKKTDSISSGKIYSNVLDKERKLIEEISSAEILEMIKDETITGGMIPKINTCLDSINNGVTAVGIIDARPQHSILFEILVSNILSNSASIEYR